MLGLLLSGCATDGPLEDGRWFLTYPPDENPFFWLARSVANMGLVAVYVGACAANLLQGYSGAIRTRS